MRVTVGKNDVRTKLVGHILQPEVHKENTVNGFQVKTPIGTLLALAGNGMGKIIQSAFAEVDLLAVLHLDNKLLTVLSRTVNVVDDTTVAHILGQDLLIQKSDIGDALLLHKKVIEKIYQQVLADFLTEDFLKTDVRERIDIFCHYGISLSVGFHKDNA